MMSLLRILAADVLRCSHLSVMIISILKKPKKLELWIQIMLLSTVLHVSIRFALGTAMNPFL